MDIIVIGAGIGGLTVALTLAKLGHTITVLEQAKAISEVGAGIQMGPNGLRVLRDLEVAEEVLEKGWHVPAIEFRSLLTNSQLAYFPLQAQSRWGEDYVTIHRADLLNALMNQVRQQDNIQCITNSQIIKTEFNKDSVTVFDERNKSYEADFVVGADGVRSLQQKIIIDKLSLDYPLSYTGYVAWRGTVSIELLNSHQVALPPSSSCVWLGVDKHLVIYRVCQGEFLNIVGITKKSVALMEDWHYKADNQSILTDFADIHPEILSVLRHTPNFFQWGMYQRPRLATWHYKRLVLLGDACHPMLPSFAQGACQAIEDAMILAQQVEQSDDLTAAFDRYYQQRIERVSQVQALSLRNLHMFHRGYSPLLKLFSLANKTSIYSSFLGHQLFKQLDWLYSSKGNE